MTTFVRIMSGPTETWAYSSDVMVPSRMCLTFVADLIPHLRKGSIVKISCGFTPETTATMRGDWVYECG